MKSAAITTNAITTITTTITTITIEFITTAITIEFNKFNGFTTPARGYER
jgi:hypothetical protein